MRIAHVHEPQYWSHNTLFIVSTAARHRGGLRQHLTRGFALLNLIYSSLHSDMYSTGFSHIIWNFYLISYAVSRSAITVHVMVAAAVSWLRLMGSVATVGGNYSTHTHTHVTQWDPCCSAGRLQGELMCSALPPEMPAGQSRTALRSRVWFVKECEAHTGCLLVWRWTRIPPLKFSSATNRPHQQELWWNVSCFLCVREWRYNYEPRDSSFKMFLVTAVLQVLSYENVLLRSSINKIKWGSK